MRALAAVLIFWCAVTARGHFAPVDVQRVPIQRALTNLMAQLPKRTNDFELLHAIARLHSMSYSKAGSNWTVEVLKTPLRRKDASQLPFFGYGPKLPPRSVARNSTAATARKHLDEAIRFYGRATSVNKSNDVAQIGLGWCLLQAGKTNDAKVAFRRGLENAWSREKKGVRLWSVTEEAIKYLRPLLDPVNDAIEIKRLDAIAKDPVLMNRMITPLAIAMEDGVSAEGMVDRGARVEFDLDGSAAAGWQWEWIRTNAAWVVHLPQGGEVTSGLQMFGSVTFWVFWENGFHALRSLDDNGDGEIAGNELRGICLWKDRNGNGKSEGDEIVSAERAGIAALKTEYSEANGVLGSEAVMRDGSKRPVFDLVLKERR